MPRSTLDIPSRAIAGVLELGGFVVRLRRTDVLSSVEAVDPRSGHRYVVRGNDEYLALIQLAITLGFELEDG